MMALNKLQMKRECFVTGADQRHTSVLPHELLAMIHGLSDTMMHEYTPQFNKYPVCFKWQLIKHKKVNVTK